MAPDRFGQGSDERGDELVAQARHLPIEAGRLQLREQGQGDHDRHPVVGRARLEAVREGEHLVALAPPCREVVLAAATGVVAEIRFGHVEQTRRARRRLLPPRLERSGVEDVSWHPVVVEDVDGLVADEDVATTLALLDLLEAATQLEVAALEGGEALVQMARLPLALHERVAKEQLTSQRSVESGELHAAFRDDLHTEKGHLLVCRGCSLRPRPVRLAHLPPGQVPGEGLRPRRVDRGDGPREQAGGLHQLRRHDRRRALLADARTGEDREAGAARAEVLGLGRCAPGRAAARIPAHVAARVEDAEVGEQPRQNGAMHGIGVGGIAGGTTVRASPAQEGAQLTVDVHPLPHPHVVHELRTTHAPERARAQFGLFLLEVLPEVQQCEEVAGRIGEARMESVRLGALGLRTLPHILDRHPGDDGEDLVEDLGALGLHEHPCEPGVDRQSRDPFADIGQAGAVIAAAGPAHGTELDEQVEGGFHTAGVRGSEEREGGDVSEAEGEHLQHHRGETGAQDLGLGELRARGEVFLGVQADGDSRCRAARASGPLLGRRLRHRFDRKALDLAASAVSRDAGGAGVDDVPDPGNGEARLGDVRRQDDAASDPGDVRALEDAVLLGGREPSVQREHLGR